METVTVFGLVTAYDWDEDGNPLRLKICAQGEDDYFVVDNDRGQKLFQHLRSWVFVTGRVIRVETQKAIDIDKINENSLEEEK